MLRFTVRCLTVSGWPGIPVGLTLKGGDLPLAIARVPSSRQFIFKRAEHFRRAFARCPGFAIRLSHRTGAFISFFLAHLRSAQTVHASPRSAKDLPRICCGRVATLGCGFGGLSRQFLARNIMIRFAVWRLAQLRPAATESARLRSRGSGGLGKPHARLAWPQLSRSRAVVLDLHASCALPAMVQDRCFVLNS